MKLNAIFISGCSCVGVAAFMVYVPLGLVTVGTFLIMIAVGGHVLKSREKKKTP